MGLAVPSNPLATKMQCDASYSERGARIADDQIDRNLRVHGMWHDAWRELRSAMSYDFVVIMAVLVHALPVFVLPEACEAARYSLAILLGVPAGHEYSANNPSLNNEGCIGHLSAQGFELRALAVVANASRMSTDETRRCNPASNPRT